MWRHFTPGAVVVEGDSITITLRRTDTEAIEIDAPGLATNWGLLMRATVHETDTVRFFVSLAHALAPTANGVRGDVAALMRGINQSYAEASQGEQLVTGTLRPFGNGDVAGVVVRGPMVALWQRRRPTRVEFLARPCIAVGDGLCGSPLPSVPVTYR